MFQHENDAAARADTITYRFRQHREDYTTDRREDWCIARLRGLPNRFESVEFDTVLRKAGQEGLSVRTLGE